MKRRLSIVLAGVLYCLTVFAQTDNLTQYIERAFHLSRSGEYEESLTAWDLYLKEVQDTEGDECPHYFMGAVYKAGVLIQAGRYVDAESLLLSSKIPSGELDMVLYLTFLKNLGTCAFHLNKHNEAIKLYSNAYSILLENKEYFPEQNTDSYHWCWSDEMCAIAHAIAKIYKDNRYYSEAEQAIMDAFDNIRQDNEKCFVYNGDSIYHLCHIELVEIYNKVLQQVIPTDNFEQALAIYDITVNTCSAYPDLIALLDYANIEYIIQSLAKTDNEKTISYVENYLSLIHSCYDFWNKTGRCKDEQCLQDKLFEYTKIAHTFCDAGLLKEAETYYLKAISAYEENDCITEDCANVLTDFANFQQECNNDYLEAVKHHYKCFKVKIDINGLYNEETIEAFSNMATCYHLYYPKVLIYQDGSQHFVEDAPEIEYGQAIDLINCWRSIVSEIKLCHSEDYFAYLEEEYKQKQVSYMLQNGFAVPEYKPYTTSLAYSYYLESLVRLQNGDLDGFIKASNKLITETAGSFIDLPDFIANISNCLDYYNYIDVEIALLKRHVEKMLDHQQYGILGKFASMLLNVLSRYEMNDSFLDIASILRPYLFDSEWRQSLGYENSVSILLDISGFFSKLNSNTQALEYAVYADSVATASADVSTLYKQITATRVANICIQTKDFKKAQEYLDKALSYSPNNKIDDYLEFLWPDDIYDNMAYLLVKTEDYEHAKSIMEKSYEHNLKFCDDNKISRTAGNLMYLAMQMHDNETAAKYATIAYEYAMKHYLGKTFALSKEIRESIWNMTNILPFGLEMFSGAALENELMIETCYNVALAQKGFQLRQEEVRKINIENCDDHELKSAYQAYKDAIASQMPNIKEVEAEYLWHYMKHPEFKNQYRFDTWEDVQKNLGKNDLAIEFTVCYKYTGNDCSYAALLLKKGWEKPKLIELCTEEQLKRIMSTGANLYKVNAPAYSCIWEKLEPYFKDGNNIYFAPHGLISQLNIEVLQGNDGKQMNKTCNLYRLSSTSQIGKIHASAAYTNATLFGGLNYNTDTTTLRSINRNYARSYSRSVLYRDSLNTRSGWAYLPGTAEEVENINGILTRNNVSTTVFKDMDGTEESFKSLSYSQVPIIHIATHGFYLTEKEARKISFFNLDDDNTGVSPLKRSGLIFSGGQHAWLGEKLPAGMDDGVLISEEIAGMDLSGTDLLVLSACQTGLGEITNEGVAGLQRGFKLAGVSTIIMSLWEVSDEATEVLMTNFYSLLAKGNSKRDAFDAAVAAVKKKYDSPEYWAAFIMLD